MRRRFEIHPVDHPPAGPSPRRPELSLPPRPADLIPIEDAARRVDRSRSTIRGWIRTGALQGWREDPSHPENTRVLVSTGALMQLVVVSGKAARPGRPPARNAAPEELASLRAEADSLRQTLLSTMESRIEALALRVSDLERVLATAQSRTHDWEVRARAAEAERDSLRGARGLPWWRRLLSAENP